MSKADIRISQWEDNEYIVEICGTPVGETVTKSTGEKIVQWLESDAGNVSAALHELFLGV